MKRTFAVMLAVPLWAQGPLSLKEAVRLAVEKHPLMEAARAQVEAAKTRVQQARSAYLPKLNYSESWQRSNNPVFVFSSLLTQHQFTEQNFQIGPLNRPDFLNNFQSQVTVDQILFDAGFTKAQTQSAQLDERMAGEERRRTQTDVIATVVKAYNGAILSEENLKAAQEAVRSAEADLRRAETVRNAGMATDADVLAIRVHLAAVREQEIRRTYEAQIAKAALNEALGLPLDTLHVLSTELRTVPAPAVSLEQEEQSAEQNRPEVQELRFSTSLAEIQSKAAHASLLPQISFRVAFESDRQRFINRGGANWFAGAFLRWNLFNGFGDKARIDEANYQVARARAQQRRLHSAVRLQVRQAYLDLKACEERIKVTEAAVAQAEENLRIIKNRYENGMANVTELLRSETALLEARVRRLAAIHDQRLAAANLDLAAGTLTLDSNVLD
jgi:outer membrane protein TolC